MPAKAAKGKGGKDDGDAKAAEEAARQAEAEAQRLQAEEEEKKRQEEEARRQADAEEAARRQAEDDKRRNEDEQRRTQEEQERKARERERDIQQLQLLEEKDKEINDLNEKVRIHIRHVPCNVAHRESTGGQRVEMILLLLGHVFDSGELLTPHLKNARFWSG